MEKEMNERIQTLLAKFKETESTHRGAHVLIGSDEIEKFAELIVSECIEVVSDVYRKTPLELCGPLLTVDEEIMKHFYGVSE
jgi:hypothetical protein